MPSPAPDTTIPGFTLLAPAIWERRPIPHLSFTNTPPSMIIILPWTGAHSKYIAKYTIMYATLFPPVHTLCITTSIKDMCLRSSKKKQRMLKPAVETILSHVDAHGGHASILVHAFSEGGSNKAVELAEAYKHTTGMRLPLSALCLDSTPGHPHYQRLCNAIKKSLPPLPVLDCTGLVIGSALLGGIWILYTCFKGYENNVVSRTRGRLQDSNYWDLAAPRCYLYSEGDELIAWQDIREHMHGAVQSGAPVLDVRFENSGHCKHAAVNPHRYWGAVLLACMWASIEERLCSDRIVTSPCAKQSAFTAPGSPRKAITGQGEFFYLLLPSLLACSHSASGVNTKRIQWIGNLVIGWNGNTAYIGDAPSVVSVD